MISRRDWLAHALGSALLVLSTREGWARVIRSVGRPSVTVYKTSTCGCCQKWIDYLRAEGFVTTSYDKTEAELDALKGELGVPAAARSCHVARLGKYLVEGHVPVEDIERLLSEQPDVLGLAAPEMPNSSPGMARPGEPHERYEVVAFRADGSLRVYARH